MSSRPSNLGHTLITPSLAHLLTLVTFPSIPIGKGLEAEARMDEALQQRGDAHQDRIQTNEQALILHDVVAPPALHLSDTVDTPDQDGKVNDNHGDGEELEFAVVAGGLGVSGERGVFAREIETADQEIRSQGAEDDKGSDLHGDTRHHHVVAELQLAVAVVRGSGEATTGALEDQGNEVGQDEAPGVVLGSQAGEFATELADNVLEDEVDGGRVEGGGEGQAADLDVEADFAEGVIIEEYATCVAKGGGETS